MRIGWELTRIGDVLTIQNGFAFDSKNFSLSRGMPLIRIRDLKGGKGTETKFDGSFESRYVVKTGDLLIGMDGEFGCYEWRGGKALLNQRVCRLEDFSGKLDPKFLFYEINKYLKEIEDATTYTTVKHLSSKQIANIEIPLPPLAEQQRIAAILDEAFAGLATATANVEKNLKNTRELFETYLQGVFDQTRPLSLSVGLLKGSLKWQGGTKLDDANSTRTGGRAASTRHIEGRRSLCVGMPKTKARAGWEWRALDELARMESGHTPSRRHPEYWGGDIPWIGIRDAKAAHGREISETLETTNKLGLENSSARLLPAQTVCLSRTASVGYVTVMGRPMATSQDFVSWVCSEKLCPQFLMYLLLAQGEEIFKFSSGAVHQTIYFPEAKAFHICLPSVSEQIQIVEALAALREQVEKLEAVYAQRISDLAEMKQAILQKAFSGELTSPPSQVIKEAAE